MSYKVSKISGSPSFDSLPVAKVTLYPLEKRDYKPYAQCILCVSDEILTLRMWAFEASPLPESSLRCVVYPFAEHPEQGICVDVFSTGLVEVAILADGVKAQDAASRLARETVEFGGEDLQGIYWGSTVSLSVPDLERIGGKTLLEPGKYFPGNFFKCCPVEPFIHQGSCFPSDFQGEPYSRDGMGIMEVVDY